MQDYEIVKVSLNEQQIKEIENLQNNLYEMKEEVERVDAEFEAMKFKLQQLMEKYRCKSIKNEYFTITYVPKVEPTVTKKLDEEQVVKLLDELGMVKDMYYKDQKNSGKKAYITWKNK